jgi:hypothetical protein
MTRGHGSAFLWFGVCLCVSATIGYLQLDQALGCWCRHIMALRLVKRLTVAVGGQQYAPVGLE